MSDQKANPTALQLGVSSLPLPAAGLTSEPGDDVFADGRNAWFSFTATATGTHVVDMNGSTGDTTVAVYVDNGGGSMTFVGWNDDNTFGLTSTYLFTATEGVDYLIQVDGYDPSDIYVVRVSQPVYQDIPVTLVEPRTNHTRTHEAWMAPDGYEWGWGYIAGPDALQYDDQRSTDPRKTPQTWTMPDPTEPIADAVGWVSLDAWTSSAPLLESEKVKVVFPATTLDFPIEEAVDLSVAIVDFIDSGWTYVGSMSWGLYDPGASSPYGSRVTVQTRELSPLQWRDRVMAPGTAWPLVDLFSGTEFAGWEADLACQAAGSTEYPPFIGYLALRVAWAGPPAEPAIEYVDDGVRRHFAR